MTATAHERTGSRRNALRENDLVTIKEAIRIAEHIATMAVGEALADHEAMHHAPKLPWYRRLWQR